jgi:hypothetical protein
LFSFRPEKAGCEKNLESHCSAHEQWLFVDTPIRRFCGENNSTTLGIPSLKTTVMNSFQNADFQLYD